MLIIMQFSDFMSQFTKLPPIAQFIPKTRRGYIRLVIVILVVLVLVKFVTSDSADVDVVAEQTPTVTTATVAELQGSTMFSTTGTVEAVSEVQLKAENGGRVVAVNTDLGKYVAAGTVIAQLENSRERAALTQAQGSYDAAVAGAAQGDSGVAGAEVALSGAKTSLETTLRNGHNTLVSILTGTVDQFFANPTSYYPGVRVRADAQFLNKERVTLQKTLPQLQKDVTAPGAQSGAVADDIIAEAERIVNMIEAILVAVERDGDDDMLAGAPLSSYAPGLYAARATLASLIASIETAEQGLLAAEETLSRAKLSGTNATVSLANAQIKIALGSLRAAQSGYEKTLVRTPIAGTVNALYIKRGDFVSPLQDVALVANNNGLQVTAAINESDRNLVSIGDMVRFDGIASGTITAIAGAVDPKTGKIALKMSVTDATELTSGTTVAVAFENAPASTTADSTLAIPLTAVKLLSTSAEVFTVDGDNKLVSRTVVLGRVLGDQVIVISGLDANTAIVLDARGRKAGEVVTLTK
jgi:RND family efflux transporter MFP subunit